jgi:hypothetical protein
MRWDAWNVMGAVLVFAIGLPSVLCAQAADGGEPAASDVLTLPPDLFASLREPPGHRLGALQVIPELDLAYVYDSNPTYSQDDTHAASSIRGRPQVGILFLGNDWRLDGKGWMSREWLLGSVDSDYQDAANTFTYGEVLKLKVGAPDATQFMVNESYECQNRKDTVVVADSGNTNRWPDRNLFTLGAGVDKPLGERTSLRAGAAYSDLWYDTTNFFGWQDVGVMLGMNRRFSEKSDVILDLGYDNQQSDAPEGGVSRCYKVLVGMGSRRTAKTAYRAQVGLMSYSYDDGHATAESWTYRLMGSWRVTPRLMLDLSGDARFQPSETEQSNYILAQTLGAGLTFEATSRLTTGVRALYIRQAAGEEDAGDQQRVDDQVNGQVRADYRLLQYTRVYVSVESMRNQSSVAGADFQRLVFQTGVNLQF